MVPSPYIQPPWGGDDSLSRLLIGQSMRSVSDHHHSSFFCLLAGLSESCGVLELRGGDLFHPIGTQLLP
jgi:hypothetical protein